MTRTSDGVICYSLFRVFHLVATKYSLDDVTDLSMLIDEGVHDPSKASCFQCLTNIVDDFANSIFRRRRRKSATKHSSS